MIHGVARRGILAFAIAAVAFSVATGTAPAAPRSTLDATIARPFEPDDPGFSLLEPGPGEPRIIHPDSVALARKGRAKRRRSLAYFAQVTDPQLADPLSPGRVEFLDPTDDTFGAAWRPQEILGPRSLDAVVRAINRNRRSPVRNARGRARLSFAITTGDMADNQQENEVALFERVLDGGTVDSFSGEPVGRTNPCPGATPPEVAALDQAVADRSYTGPQDYDDYPGAPATQYPEFWDPDVPVASGRFAAFASHPGLNERALEPFKAKGLRVPWFNSRGNHDGLVQGNAPANQPAFRAVATGCQKIYPISSPLLDPGDDPFPGLGDPLTLPLRLALGAKTPPDPDRDFASHKEYTPHPSRRRTTDTATDSSRKGQRKASEGEAMHYALQAGAGPPLHLDGRGRRGRRGRQRRRPAVPLDRASPRPRLVGRVRRRRRASCATMIATVWSSCSATTRSGRSAARFPTRRASARPTTIRAAIATRAIRRRSIRARQATSRCATSFCATRT